MSQIYPQLEAPLELNPPALVPTTDAASVRLQDLQLQMTRAAMCHQYAQMEYEGTVCCLRRGELLEEMELYHQDYQQARVHIAHFHPEILTELELDLRAQKQLVFGHYQA